MANTPVPLDQLDPTEAWQPWRPSANQPWSPKWAAHLYGRAAFAPSRQDLAEAVKLGVEGTLDLLFRGQPRSEDFQETLNDIGLTAAQRDDGGTQLIGWWLYCMLQGGQPLREKLTLFWHNHFATSLVKVRNPVLMFRQNCLLRAHALGRFGPLVQAISKDGAMLVWLDSNSNIKDRPNENYARELMELFTLGVGNYTEKDIRAAARAFTGWRIERERFAFDARLHDGGAKTVLGQTGNWNGDDVVRILLGQPATARFLVRKFYRFYISENTEPSDRFLQPLVDAFRQSDYDIAALVRTVLSSRHFYSAHAFRQRLKGPVEYVVGAIQQVYRRYAETEREFRPLPQQMLVRWLGAMGQPLFSPPNVKGWPGGRAWLNTSTVLERDNFAQALVTGSLWAEPFPAGTNQLPELVALERTRARAADGSDDPAPPLAFDPARLLNEEGGAADPANRPRTARIVDQLFNLYVPGGARPEIRSALVEFLAEGNPAGAALQRRVREAVHAILTTTEYQLI